MQYRRAKAPGATYFFTVVTYQRQTVFDDAEMVDLLRQSFRVVKRMAKLNSPQMLAMNKAM